MLNWSRKCVDWQIGPCKSVGFAPYPRLSKTASEINKMIEDHFTNFYSLWISIEWNESACCVLNTHNILSCLLSFCQIYAVEERNTTHTQGMISVLWPNR